MNDLTPDQIASVDPAYWANLYKIKLQAGEFSFLNREFQIKPMQSRARRKCYKKARQSFGATELEVLDDLHGMIYGHYKLGVAHIFPSSDEVGEFGKARFKPLITSNRIAIGQYVRDTDTATLKRVRDAFLWLRGARLSQKIGDTDEDTSSKTAAFSVDKVVLDEVDFMDLLVIEKFINSMGSSPVKREVYLGNPSHEDFGIDLIFKQSNQQYWFRRCGCGHWTCAEKSFPNCVKIRPDGTGYIGCDKCGQEVKMWNGKGTAEWVADFPSKSGYMEGYHLSQLSNIFVDPAEVLESYTNPLNNNLADVYRLKLGTAYSAKEDKLRKSDVLACCGSNLMAESSTNPCAMGVDVGKVKHVVIGIKTHTDRFEIIKVAKVETFNDVYMLAKKYNVKSDVIDIRPYEDEARSYQKSSGHKTFLCEYSESMLQDALFNDDTGIVKVHRTGIFDSTHKLFTEGRIKIPRQCTEIEEFARQCCNCAKFEEKDKKKGTIIFRYRPTGDCEEHFRSALNYFLLAASGSKLARVKSEFTKSRQTVTKNDYAILG